MNCRKRSEGMRGMKGKDDIHLLTQLARRHEYKAARPAGSCTDAANGRFQSACALQERKEEG